LLSKGGFEFEIVSPRVAEEFIALTLSFFATASVHPENISLILAGQ